MLPLVALVLAVTSQAATTAGDTPHRVVCYFQSWSVYRPDNGLFEVEDIDPSLCTHHVYAFAGLNSSLMIHSLDPFNDLYEGGGKGAYLRFTGMKQNYPEIKTMLSIGGWTEGSARYSQMAASAEYRATFAASVVEFLTRYNFDGLDMDWEYPTQREGSSPEDRENFTLLLKDLYEALHPRGLLLSSAFAGGKQIFEAAYELSEVGTYLDFMNLMSFDYHGDWDAFVGHDAPLYLTQKDIDHGQPYIWFNVNYTTNYYLQSGVEPSKLNIGFPLYGRGFVLEDPSNHEPYDRSLGAMDSCPYSGEKGFCDYIELCEVIFSQPGWTDVFDTNMQATYSYKDNLWIGWDDSTTVHVKLDYLKSMGVGGAILWSIDTDDFRGACGPKYPIASQIWSELNGA